MDIVSHIIFLIYEFNTFGLQKFPMALSTEGIMFWANSVNKRQWNKQLQFECTPIALLFVKHDWN